VVCYRFLSLADGKASLRLLDGKTDWQVEAHAPKWQRTGVEVDLKTFGGKPEAAPAEFIHHVSVHRRDKDGDHALSANAPPGFQYADQSLKVIGSICDCTTSWNGERGSRTDAFVVAELREKSDGIREWQIALLRNGPDELWLELDGHEICRLPAVTEKDPVAYPVRIEPF
jgi:hypothetical protein